MRRDELQLRDPPTADRPGDRWMCGRAADDSPCAQGPGRFGRCPLAEACRPRRTWQGRRKRVSTAAFALVMLTMSLVAWDRWRAEIIKPGNLASPHAQILSGKLTSDRCGTCHVRASASLLQWFSTDIPGHANVSQTDRCLNCHHTTIDRSRATLAHNLPDQLRNSIRLASTARTGTSWHDLLPGPDFSQQDVQCNACHREHRGADNNLSAVSDAQCQTCHADRFGSFATSHPDWNDWPYGRAQSVSFNHATHASKHFPAARSSSGPTPFQCADCHVRSIDNELTRTVSYERACKSCHDQGLGVQSADGLELLAIPSLPQDSVDRIGGWPEQATGFFDGAVSPLTQLLIRSDADGRYLLRDIPGANLANIDGSNSNAVAAAEQVAQACRELLGDLVTNGQSAVTRRIVAAGVTESSAESFVRSLPTQLLVRAEQLWFRNQSDVIRHSSVQPQSFRAPVLARPDDRTSRADPGDADDDLLLGEADEALLLDAPVSAGDPLLGDPLVGDSLDGDPLDGDPLDGDPLDGDPLDGGPRPDQRRSGQSRQGSSRAAEFNPEAMLPAGGWYRDDTRLAIQYLGSGHADPVLQAAVDLISELASSDPVRVQLLAVPAIASCFECHPGAVRRTGAWTSSAMIGRKTEFTKFRHAPHLNIAVLSDCRHCHQVASSQKSNGQVTLAAKSDRGGPRIDPEMPVEFEPMSRQACAQCHRPHAAGDACIKCHRYHIEMR